MTKTWIISDTHWYHKNIGKFCGRPDNHMERTIKHWQTMVGEKDKIIHLGDVIFGNKAQLKEILDTLPGVKILTRGNHDRHSYRWYEDAGFDFCCDKIVLHDIIFSHKPMPIGKYGSSIINIHGHFHNVVAQRWELSLVNIVGPSHFLYSLEYFKYQPCLLNDKMLGKLMSTKKRMEESRCVI